MGVGCGAGVVRGRWGGIIAAVSEHDRAKYGFVGTHCALCGEDRGHDPVTGQRWLNTCDACWQRLIREFGGGYGVIDMGSSVRCAECSTAVRDGRRSECRLHAINLLTTEQQRERLIAELRAAGLVGSR